MKSFDGRIVLNPITLYGYTKDAVKMFWAAIRGRYPVPGRSIVWGSLFLVYFIIPFDIVPEIVFSVLGFADELLFLVFVINKIKTDIDAFRVFEASSKKTGKIRGKK